MTLGELLDEYVEGKRDAIETIRTLTGIVREDNAISILAIVNQITRIEQGDMDKDLFKDLYTPKDQNETK